MSKDILNSYEEKEIHIISFMKTFKFTTGQSIPIHCPFYILLSSPMPIIV